MSTPQTPNQFQISIENFIKENRGTFKNSPSRIISDYQGEESLRKAYDGRQILEILQNADDAGAKIVEIHLDKKTKQLTFSNTGTPFSAEGIGSLMISNLSTKRGRKKMIGNKGLGFRSILNWADRITIISNSTEVEFSPENALSEFYLAVPDEGQRQALLTSHQYPLDFVPFPFLGIPKVTGLSEDNADANWDTQIIVDLSGGLETIINDQLNDFKKEILIFLNNIENLTINIDGKISVYNADKNDLDPITSGNHEIIVTEVGIEDESWRVFSLTELLPPKYQEKNTLDKQYYNIQIAVKDDLSDNYRKLFTYFPTQISLHLPYLVHGSFELDPSRNHLTNSDKNPFHLKQLVKLIGIVAMLLGEAGVDWRPYRLLSPLIDKDDDERINEFYAELIKEKRRLKVFPCIDESFRACKEAVFYGVNFSNYVIKYNFKDLFKALVKPLPPILQSDSFIIGEVNTYTSKSFVEVVNGMGARIRDNSTLAELVQLLTQPEMKRKEKGKIAFSILLNKERKQVPATYTVFTPVTKKNEFYKPEYAKFDFLNKGLFEELIYVFKIPNNSLAARELQNKLRDSFNIQTYEPAPVILTFINSAIKAIDGAKLVESRKIIEDMVRGLYAVFMSLSSVNYSENNRVEEAISAGVPLLNRSNKIAYNTALVFGKDYPEGKLTEDLFKGIYTFENYLALPSKWGFVDEDIFDIWRFFNWLKVGSFSQLEKWTEGGNDYQQPPYIKYIYNTLSKPEYRTYINASGLRIKDVDKILKQVGLGISREQILAWVIKDQKVSEAMIFSKDKFNYTYGGKDVPKYPKINYIRWQFLKSGVFNNYVIEEQFQEGINPFKINFSDPIFKSNDIEYSQIVKALSLVGAYESFDEMPVTEVFKLLNNLRNGDKTKSGRNTAAIYKLALKNFNQIKNRDAAVKHGKPYLFARKGAETDYRPAGEVYYADNHTVPLRVIENVWLLNLQKRSGERQVREFLGTKTFENLRPQIILGSVVINQYLQREFNEWMQQARILILAFRIESLKMPDEKQNAADLLEDMEIVLVDKCDYLVEDIKRQQLNESEFINEGKKFYFRTPETCNTFGKLERLTPFRDAFAEMLCVLFRVTELKNDFRNVIALGLKDSRHILETEHDSWVLKEATELSQVNISELNFWKRVLGHLKISLPSNRLSRDQFIEGLQQLLKIKFPSNYKQLNFDDFKDAASFDFLRYLTKKVNVPVNICCPVGLFQHHMNALTIIIEDYEKAFEYKLWLTLQDDIKLQKTFIKRRDKYLHIKNDAAKKIAKENNFKTDVSYDKLLRTAIYEQTNIQLIKNEETPYFVTMLYSSLRSKYEEEWHGLSPEFESLAYFKGNNDKLKAELIKIRSKDEKPDDDPIPPQPDNDPRPAPVVKINYVQLSKASRPVPVNPSRKPSKRSVFDIRMNKHFHHAGKEAEKLVLDSLVQAYGRENVRWISGNSDETFAK